MLNGKPLALDVAFTLSDGRQFPANWMRNASISEKNAIGITEVSDPAQYDRRFYWGKDNPKDLAGLKANWIDQQKITASSELGKSDWMIIRKEETSTAVPSATQTYRTAVRTQCNKREDQINACDTTDKLAALIGDGKRKGDEKFDTSKEVKDSEGNSYDPKKYESFDPKQYEADVTLEAWPTE